MVDHMIDGGELEPLYIVSPCFYDPKETDKTPTASGVAVKRFIGELRDELLPLAENHIGRPFLREERAIGGFSMGGVTTWYAFMEALDLFYWFLPLSGDCWACGEKSGGEQTEATVQALIEAVSRQGSPDFRVHAITGSRDIAFPNLDPQMKAMEAHPDVFGGRVRYDVMEGGVHDYETIFRYLYNALPEIGAGESEEPWRAEKVELVRQYHRKNLDSAKGGIVFVGSSLMEMFPIEEWVAEMPEPRPLVYNRGVGGYTKADLLPILDIVAWEMQPGRVFINIGTNDLSDASQTIKMIMARYDEILARIEAHLPGVPITVMAYYPVNPDVAEGDVKECLKVRSNARIAEANAAVKQLAENHGQRFIDLNGPLTDAQGRLKAEYTIEGIHINHAGYRSIFCQLMRYAMDG